MLKFAEFKNQSWRYLVTFLSFQMQSMVMDILLMEEVTHQLTPLHLEKGQVEMLILMMMKDGQGTIKVKPTFVYEGRRANIVYVTRTQSQEILSITLHDSVPFCYQHFFPSFQLPMCFCFLIISTYIMPVRMDFKELFKG